MTQNTNKASMAPQLDRLALYRDLEALTSLSGAHNPLHEPSRVRDIARDALQLLGDYDDVLRGLALSLSAGGYNSAGLIDPTTADDKIRWGIEHLLSVERLRAKAESVAATEVSPQSSQPSLGAAAGADVPMPFHELAGLVAQHYEGGDDLKVLSLGDWRTVSYSPVPEFHAYLSIPLRDWRWYARQASPAPR